MNKHKTKIVCSIGPSSNNDDIIRKMLYAGMNVARFNFSHGTHEWHKEAMDRVKRVSNECGIPVAIMLDTKGPEIRTGNTHDNQIIQIKTGDKIHVVSDGSECYAAKNGLPGHISLSWKEAPQKIKAGVKILIADGLVALDVDSCDGEKIYCTATNSGAFSSKKNVNLIGIHAGLPIMSEQDLSDIAFGAEQDVDFIAASFVSFPEEVVQIREYLSKCKSGAKIIAKIESNEGLMNLDRIIAEADGIMVARGDLGVQIPMELVPLAQKKIISKCRRAGKPVITATQMLDSMIQNPRPTRAESTDVANAVFDGTDAVMLSGETAGGKYPVESVETMALITRTTEKSHEYRIRMDERTKLYSDDTGDLGKTITHSAFTIADSVKAKAIITPTLHGNTTRMISRFRPEQIILAVTPDPRTARQLLLNWGVLPMLCTVAEDSNEMIQNSIKKAKDDGKVSLSDRVVVVAGIPLHSPLMANTIKIVFVGNILARGSEKGHAEIARPQAYGRIVIAHNAKEAAERTAVSKQSILVCHRITEEYIPALRMSEAVIAEAGSDLSAVRLGQVNKNLIWITDAHKALETLENGCTVTIDGKQGLVYEGKI